MALTLHRRRGALPPAVRLRVREIAAAAEAHDGVEALGEQPLLHLTDGAAVLHLLVGAEASGSETLVGYAQLDDRPGAGDAELVVLPDARDHGAGRLLVTGLRDATLDEPSPLAIWAHGNLPAAQALARSTGLVPVRELWRMSRDLAPAGSGPARPWPLPDGVRLRALGEPPRPAGAIAPTRQAGADADAWLALNATAFAHHPEQGRMTLADLHARWEEPWFDPRDLLLAEQGGAVVGSLWLKVEPGSDEGEIYVLAVAPEAQGRGLGRALTAVALDHMASRGLRRAVLFTEADNHAAVRTYTAAGFTPDRVDAQYG